jgi:hypothetical protein
MAPPRKGSKHGHLPRPEGTPDAEERLVWDTTNWPWQPTTQDPDNVQDGAFQQTSPVEEVDNGWPSTSPGTDPAVRRTSGDADTSILQAIIRLWVRGGQR